MKRLLILVVLSLAVSTGIFYINSNIIKSSWTDTVSEIGILAIPVFIVLSILYYANRAIIKKVRGTIKKPSGKKA